MALRQNSIRVQLQLDAQGFLNGLNQISARARRMFADLGAGIERTVGSDSLQLAGWTSGFALIERAGFAAFEAIKRQIQDAADLQTSLIGAAASYQQLLNINFGQAKGLARQANLAFVNATIGLPFENLGSTLRAALGDDLLGALYNANDVAGSIEQSARILSRLQVLIGGTTGVNMGQQMGLVTDLMTGDYKKITGQEAFRNNPILSRVFEEIVASLGGELKFNSLTKSEKVRQVVEPLSKAISDDVINAYTNTAGGFLSTINNGLFGVDGIFSFSRNLIFNLPDTSLMDSFTGLLKEISALLTNLYPIIKGIVDPIAIFFKLFIDGISLILKPINMILDALGLLEPAFYALSAAMSTLFYIGLARAALAVATSVGTEVAATAGTATNGATGVATAVNNPVGQFFAGNGFNPLLSVLQGILGAVRNIGSAAISGGGGLGSLLGFIPAIASVAGLLSRGGGIFAGIARFIPVLISGIGGIAASIGGVGAALLSNPIVLGIAGIAAGAYAIYANWSGISGFFGDIFNGIGSGFTSLGEFIGGIGNGIGEIFGNVGGFINDLFANIGNTISGIGNTIGGVFQNIFSFLTGSKNASIGGGLFGGNNSGGSDNPVANFLRFISGGWLNFASGNTSMFDALINEQNQMPNGASPVIANSSEMILNKGQQNNLASALTSRGSMSLSVNQTFNVNGSQSPEEIARISIDALNNWWSQTQSEYAY
jgi:phage-related protein